MATKDDAGEAKKAIWSFDTFNFKRSGRNVKILSSDIYFIEHWT